MGSVLDVVLHKGLPRRERRSMRRVSERQLGQPEREPEQGRWQVESQLSRSRSPPVFS